MHGTPYDIGAGASTVRDWTLATGPMDIRAMHDGTLELRIANRQYASALSANVTCTSAEGGVVKPTARPPKAARSNVETCRHSLAGQS
jgi:hypothetical protein